jgi:ATP-binding cassette, subfamily B, bacterial MsbA
MTSNRLLLRFARNQIGLVSLTVFLGFLSAFLNGISTALVIPVVLGFLGGDFAYKGLPSFLQRILFLPRSLPENQQALAMLSLVFLVVLLKGLASYGASLSSSRLTQVLTSKIRKEGIRALLEVDLDYFHKNKLGDLSNLITSETDRTAASIRTGASILTASISILVFTGFLLAISWQLTLIATALLALSTLGNQFFVRNARRFGRRYSETSSQYSVTQFEVLSGIRLIKSTGQEDVEYRHLSKLVDANERAFFLTQTNFGLVPIVNEILGIAIVLVVVIVGKSLLLGQVDSLASMLLTYLLVLFRLLPFVTSLNTQRTVFSNDLPSVKIISDFLRRDNKPFMQNGAVRFTGLQNLIQFDKITFSYPGTSRSVLQEITLKLPKGKTLALVGTSGAGKSTLADLLPRFYDCDQGQILIDGQDLRSYDLTSLRQAMGIVSQEAFLFNDTLFNNIAYGCPGATEADVIQAVKRANAYEFIRQLPQGLQTIIGDRGVLLSGGQRQRVVIARALLRNPEILILDEATSALDTVSERLVQQAIDELSRDRTVLVIAHRLSTIQNADQIAVFDQGRVVEVGKHSELLARDGYYAKLYNMQFRDSDSAPVLAECRA